VFSRKDDEADVVGGDIAKRGVAGDGGVRWGGALTKRDPSFEAQAEKDIGGVAGWTGRGDRRGRRKGWRRIRREAFRQRREEEVIFSRRNLSAPPVELDELDGAIVFGRGGLNGFDGDRRDFFADAVRRGLRRCGRWDSRCGGGYGARFLAPIGI